MKVLKNLIAMVVFAVVLSLSTVALAYGGTGDVDSEMKIGMPATLNGGKGNVSGVSGSMKYQFIEISESKYNNIKLLEDEYDLMVKFEDWVDTEDKDISDDDKYNAACEEFETKYNLKVSDIVAKYKISPDLSTLIRADWIAELTSFDSSKWETANGSTIELDLSTFKGTKYFIGWIEMGSIHDAEAYKVTGTKQDTPAPTQPENKVEPENTVEPENKVEPEDKEEKKDETTKPQKITTPKKDVTTSDSDKLPHTGITDALPVFILVVISIGLVFYKKYSEIK